MAEEGSVYELEGFEKQLQSLLKRHSSDELRADGKSFCSDYCKVVEEYTSRWQVPLPQLRILEMALCYFARASSSFTSNCDHVLHTLSSLALSVFELLLFLDEKDFHQEPLKHFTVTFQECHSALARHQNVHLLQVERLVRAGGAWASSALQAILSESSLPQNEVDGCLSSELPVFFELRVRYLLSCERVSEALALAKCCARHPTVGQHLFFLQVYLTWLYKTSQHDRLHKEADLSGKDAVHIICSLESDETDEVLLGLSRAFIYQQLSRGDMHYLCDLVFVWSKLHSRSNTSKQALLEESHQLMLSATNVSSIFPFIRVILQELGEDGIQFCVELCANALESCLPCDVVTKSLIYKTIAGLLPNDLEVCRACALLVFFMERTVEAYKMMYLHYMHPDQEYHVECSPIRNHIRFETLQVLKKDLYFDPEFWNLIALRTNCLKLMNEKEVGAALEEILEEKWLPNYCTKELASVSSASVGPKEDKGQASRKRQQKEDSADMAPKRLKVGQGRTQLSVDHAVRKKSKRGSRYIKETSEPLRRSFWQLDRIKDNAAIGYGQQRRTTRLSEKNRPKRRIKKPKWLLEDSGTLEENYVPSKMRKHRLNYQKDIQSSIVKRPESGHMKNNTKLSVNSHLKARENNTKHHKGFSSDCNKPSAPPQVILELSLPDNELMGTFTEDTCNRQRGYPQMLFYKPTVKVPSTSQPVKAVHGKEVILRARDASMFVQQLHCYVRRQKGKGNGPNIHGSVSTITRSSVQGSPPKDAQRELCETPDVEMKDGLISRTTAAAEPTEVSVLEKISQAQKPVMVSQKKASARELFEKSVIDMKVGAPTSVAAKVTETQISEAQSTAKLSQTKASAIELCEEPAVEMKVTIASQTPALAKVTQPPATDQVTKDETVDVSKTAVVSKTLTVQSSQVGITEEIPLLSSAGSISGTGAPRHIPSPDVFFKDGETFVNLDGGKDLISVFSHSGNGQKCEVKAIERDALLEGNQFEATKTEATPPESDNINDISDLTLVTEMVAELTPAELARDLESHKRQNSADSPSKESVMLLESKGNVPYEIRTTSSCSAPEHGAFVVADWQSQNKEVEMDDSFSELPENSESMEMIPESEESKLEFCCTFCNKVFKGSRVVAHAMFHFRKDECMFCGTMFRDDLLAMMHLSDHIEKLKRSKESAGNIAQQNWVSETKDVSTPKTSAKTKNTNTSPGHRRSRRLRKSSICPKSLSHSASDLSPSQLKKLRSNDKSADDQFLRQKKPNKQFNKVNGHIGIKKMKRGTLQSEAKQLIPQQEVTQDKVKDGAVSPAMSETCDKEEICPGTSVRQLKEVHCSREDNMKETLQVLKTDTKQNKKFSEETKVEPLEQVCCPVDGCTWFTDLSKNRVALLYHALEDHYGDVKPLELSFQIANNKCSICMRVLWSFEHFQHHVERHRLIPRHPCLHQGCTARFKSGMEMRRHARKHSPLQAVCCLPGCSKLFICLWALNLHEREHYASKPTKAAKNTNFQTNNKQDDAQVCKKQSHKSKDASATTAESVKTARKLRGQATHNLSTEKDIAVSSLSTVKESESKQQLKVKSESKDSHVLKNLSNKDTTRKSTGPNLRLRHTLRKVTKTNMSTKTPKFFSLPLLKRNGKLRHKLKRQVKVNTKGHKRRGRPPKPKKAVHDENTTTGGKNCDSLQHKTAQIPTDPPDTAEMQTASKRLEEDSLQVQDVIKITETSNDKPKSKISLSEEIKCDQMEQKGTSHSDSKGNVAAEGLNQLMATTLADKSQKLTTDSVRKILKRRYAPKENGQNAFSHSSKAKKRKIENKVDAKTVKKKRPRKDPEFSTGSKNSDESKVVALKVESSADDEGKTKVENTDSTQVSPSDSKPAGSTNTHNAPTTSGEEKPKKCHSSKEGTTKIASLDSGKKNKHKVNNDRGAKKMSKKSEPRKDRTSALKKPKSAPQVESKTSSEENVPDSDQKEAKNPISTTPTVTANGIEEVSSSTTTSKNTQEKNSKESPVKKKSNKANEAKKKEDKIKVKKKCQDNSSATKVSQVTAAKAEQVESSSGEDGITLGKILGRPRYSDSCKSVIVDQKPTLCMDTLAEYGKKPHMRVPPTAYLDERFTTMPKRRKEMSYFQSSPKSPPQVQACVPAALQRQRCANCFTTFNSAEELQSHRQLQGCSSLFGFDSDEEGNS